MDKFKQWPVVLRRKWLLSLAMGAMFFIVGLVMFFTLRDRTLLFISFLLTLCVLQRCHSFYQMAQEETYEVIEGVCISLDRAILRKRQSVRLLQYDGNECALTLDKRTSLRIGNCYRVYLKPDINSGYEVPVLDVFLSRIAFWAWRTWVNTTLKVQELNIYRKQNEGNSICNTNKWRGHHYKMPTPFIGN